MEPLLLQLQAVPCMADTLMVQKKEVVFYAINTIQTLQILEKHTPQLIVKVVW
jgi:hypothetical protein